jgi:hypothetical protein
LGRKYADKPPSAKICREYYGSDAQTVYQFMKRREHSILEVMDEQVLEPGKLRNAKDQLVTVMIAMGRYERNDRRRKATSRLFVCVLSHTSRRSPSRHLTHFLPAVS